MPSQPSPPQRPASPPSLRSILLNKPAGPRDITSDPTRFPRLRRFWSERKLSSTHSTPPKPLISPPSRLAPLIAYSPSSAYSTIPYPPASSPTSEYPSIAGSSFSLSHPLNILRPRPTRAPPSTPVSSSRFRTFLRQRRPSDSPETEIATTMDSFSPPSADTESVSPRRARRKSWSAGNWLSSTPSRSLELADHSSSDSVDPNSLLLSDRPHLEDPFPSTVNLAAPSIDINFEIEDDSAWRNPTPQTYAHVAVWERELSSRPLVERPSDSDQFERAIRRGIRDLSINSSSSQASPPQFRRSKSNPILNLMASPRTSPRSAASPSRPLPPPAADLAPSIAASPSISSVQVLQTPQTPLLSPSSNLPFDFSPSKRVSPGKNLIPSKYTRPLAGARRPSTASDISAHFPFLGDENARPPPTPSDESTTLPAWMTHSAATLTAEDMDYDRRGASSSDGMQVDSSNADQGTYGTLAQAHLASGGGGGLAGPKRESPTQPRTAGKRKKVRRTRSIELELVRQAT